MTLQEIPANEIVLVDANIILYDQQGASLQCTHFLRRCAEKEITGVVTSHILAEVMHRLMMTEARENLWSTGGNPARQLAEKPEKVKLLSRYSTIVKSIMVMGVIVEPVKTEDFHTAIHVQQQYGLLTNDALLIAVADRLRIEAIASSDKMFSTVSGIHVYSPDDL